MYLPQENFTKIIQQTPLVSIDLVIENSQKQILLGYRNNRPAKGYWFVPGGRILKDETMVQAFQRLTENELGTAYKIGQAEFLGPYEHFYNDSVFDEAISTHYVVMGYKLILDIELSDLPKEQHHQFKWFSHEALLNTDNVHRHTKWYLDKQA